MTLTEERGEYFKDLTLKMSGIVPQRYQTRTLRTSQIVISVSRSVHSTEHDRVTVVVTSTIMPGELNLVPLFAFNLDGDLLTSSDFRPGNNSAVYVAVLNEVPTESEVRLQVGYEQS
jgi:hypothetical protein